MKKGILFLFIIIIFSACSKENYNSKPYKSGDELVGSWINHGTFYAGTQIMGSTEFIFNSDKTFVALDKAKGMPTLTETGSWIVSGDTLKMKFRKSKKNKPDVIVYEERNGGAKDIIKPVPADSSGNIAWNYKINGSKLILANADYGYTGSCELVKE